jgi:hypothetical protein
MRRHASMRAALSQPRKHQISRVPRDSMLLKATACSSGRARRAAPGVVVGRGAYDKDDPETLGESRFFLEYSG